ncbi:MAG TPA: IclR family transcriptional regulator [Clostridiales bacterium]|nr:IclR family transcriptional regulator [Clostridiales bacterium]
MSENLIRSAQRMFNILEILASKGELGVTELSLLTNLNKATVHRQLNTLSSMGYVRQDEKSEKYTLTFKLIEVAGQFLNHIDMRTAARPYLDKLAELTGETVHLVQKEGLYCVYIDKVEPTVNSIRMVSRIGLRQPLYCTAVGKSILASLSDQEIRAIWNRSEKHKLTPNTITDWEAFKKEIEKIRKSGYAVDDEENELGVKCVAVALKDFSGQVCHAISVSAPVSRMDDKAIKQIAKLLIKTRQDFYGNSN